MIRLEQVSKDFGPVRAVTEVTFQVGRGTIAGFLGPNGAGKSTVLKMIATWLPPTRGRIQVAGLDVAEQGREVRRQLGYLPEHNALYDRMRVDRFLEFVAGTHELAAARRQERMSWALDALSLHEVLGKRIRECSKGFRQRIGLAAALLHDPAVLLLDEPTHGLDPLQVVAFRSFLKELARDRAILFSSHILHEVVGLSDQLLVIHQGRLVVDRPTRNLEQEAADAGATVEERILERIRAQATP